MAAVRRLGDLAIARTEARQAVSDPVGSAEGSSASVKLPLAMSLPSAVTVPEIRMRDPTRPTTSAVARSRTPGPAAAGNLKSESPASLSSAFLNVAAARPPVCASSSTRAMARITGCAGKCPSKYQAEEKANADKQKALLKEKALKS